MAGYLECLNNRFLKDVRQKQEGYEDKIRQLNFEIVKLRTSLAVSNKALQLMSEKIRDCPQNKVFKVTDKLTGALCGLSENCNDCKVEYYKTLAKEELGVKYD